MTFNREPFSDALLGEMLPLLRCHWAEVAHYVDIPLEVDASIYHAAEANGALRIYTVRMGDYLGMRLLGYAVYFVRANPHYASSVQAVQDVIYVDPHRRGIGRALFEFTHQELAAEGVQVVYQHVKLAHNFGPKLLEPMGYEAVETIYAKRLDV